MRENSIKLQWNSNCHLFLTFIHNPFIKCKAMDDFVKLWSHVVALFVEFCFYFLPFLLSFVFIFLPFVECCFFCCPFCWVSFLFVALFVECCLPMRLVSSVCSSSSTVRDYFHTVFCISFLAPFLCISVFLVVYFFLKRLDSPASNVFSG